MQTALLVYIGVTSTASFGLVLKLSIELRSAKKEIDNLKEQTQRKAALVRRALEEGY
jgi:hypothetical protein